MCAACILLSFFIVLRYASFQLRLSPNALRSQSSTASRTRSGEFRHGTTQDVVLMTWRRAAGGSLVQKRPPPHPRRLTTTPFYAIPGRVCSRYRKFCTCEECQGRHLYRNEWRDRVYCGRMQIAEADFKGRVLPPGIIGKVLMYTSASIHLVHEPTPYPKFRSVCEYRRTGNIVPFVHLDQLFLLGERWRDIVLFRSEGN
jgi:hypothetical protein